MSTFVFVAGGWHGGWCWKRVARRLRAEGHEVHTPTLTGLGERAHLFGPGIDLETHIADVLGLLEWEDLDEVTLVGHSYGGMVITAVADRAPERLARVVYFDALWPVSGESVADIIGHEAAAIVDAAGADPDDPPHLLGAAQVARLLGVTDPDDAAWLASKLTPQSPATTTQPLYLKGDAVPVPVLFIACTATSYEGPELSHSRARALAAADPRVRTVTLTAGHDAMVTDPDAVVEALTAPAS